MACRSRRSHSAWTGRVQDDFFKGEEAKVSGLLALYAGVLGALIGAAVGPGERWEEIERGQRLSLALTLPKRGIGAQVQVGW